MENRLEWISDRFILDFTYMLQQRQLRVQWKRMFGSVWLMINQEFGEFYKGMIRSIRLPGGDEKGG